MNTYKWSAINNAFLPVALVESYKENKWDISDLVDISDEIADEFMSDWPDGKSRIVGSDGLPAWGDALPPTHEQVIAASERKKTELLSEAEATISIWQSKLLLNIISDKDKASLLAWLTYIDDLNAIETDSAPDINWPSPPL